MFIDFIAGITQGMERKLLAVKGQMHTTWNEWMDLYDRLLLMNAREMIDLSIVELELKYGVETYQIIKSEDSGSGFFSFHRNATSLFF